MNEKKIKRGAQILIDKWITLKPGERLLIITDKLHEHEMRFLFEAAICAGGIPTIEIMAYDELKKGVFAKPLSEMIFDTEVIIGAGDVSIASNQIIGDAVKKGIRFLSLPMSTTKKDFSFLESDLMLMDPAVSVVLANHLIEKINKSSRIRIITSAGTDLTFSKIGRNAKFFVGSTAHTNNYASSSFEVYLAIEESKTNGVAVLDGSLGYLGLPQKPFEITLKEGRITNIEQTDDGQILEKYINDFCDKDLFVCSELGIGLNLFAKCDGTSYIEDESAYGTFHTGFGRNISFGGKISASGHFDLVYKNPTIYADNDVIMDSGSIVIL